MRGGICSIAPYRNVGGIGDRMPPTRTMHAALVMAHRVLGVPASIWDRSGGLPADRSDQARRRRAEVWNYLRTRANGGRGFSVSEVATMTGFGEDTVRMGLRRADVAG